jgi:PPIC-type PPIASE domain
MTPSTRSLVRLAITALLLFTVACGRGPKSQADLDGEPVAIEYVPIAVGWVKRNAAAKPEDMKAWASSPAGRAAAGSTIRHILVRVRDRARPKEIAAAKRRAQELLARVEDGDDVRTIAEEASDDEATRAKGGALGTDAALLPDGLKTVAEKLQAGQAAKAVVRTSRGFHVLTRDAVDEKSLRAAYQKARTPELTRQLTDELLSKMRASNAPLDEIAKETIGSVLGEAAATDEKRHPAVSLPRARAGSADVPEDAKEALAAFARKAKPGDVVDSALGTGPVLVVARAVAMK